MSNPDIEILEVISDDGDTIHAAPAGGESETIMYTELPSKEEDIAIRDAIEDLEEVSEEIPSDVSSPVVTLEITPEIEEVLEFPQEASVFVVNEIPGASQIEEISESVEEILADEKTEDENKIIDKPVEKPKDKWDYKTTHGLKNIIDWAQQMVQEVPEHTGSDVGGLKRAAKYVEKIISKLLEAIENDLDGELDAKKIDDAVSKLEDARDRIKTRLEKISKLKSKKASPLEYKLTKVAAKDKTAASNIVDGVVVVVPLLTSRLARICIKSSMQGGHDLTEVFNYLVKKFKYNEREEAELVQLLEDMGYPLPTYDRGEDIHDTYDQTEFDKEYNPRYPG
jgi:hypothetical protein